MAEVLTQLTDVFPGNEDPGCLHLSFSERIIGFGIASLCGMLAGTLAIFSLFILNLRKFSVLFTVSTLLFIGALAMLVGCKRILSSCGERKRMISSIGLVCGIITTLTFGLFKRVFILAIAGFVLEIISYLYFVLTFIPGGERFFHLILF